MVLKNVISISHHTTATLNGQMNAELEEEIQPVIPNMTGSPIAFNPNLPIPQFVLTRNHCLGGCVDCLPAQDAVAFHKACHTVTTVQDDGGLVLTPYPANLTQASLTLVRNPFDVIRTRMNRGFVERQGTFGWTDEEIERMTDSNEGLHVWCRIVDEAYEKADREELSRPKLTRMEQAIRTYNGLVLRWRKLVKRCKIIQGCPEMEFWPNEKFRELGKHLYKRQDFKIDTDVKHRYKDLPCYSEWLRYVQWYNHALQLTRSLRERILYFEEFVERRARTYADLIQTLQLPEKGGKVPFSWDRASHKNIFSPSEARMAANLVLQNASPEVWEVLSRYFESEDWFDLRKT